MMYWIGGMQPWGYLVMVVTMVAFWALVVGALVLVARSLTSQSDTQRQAAGAPSAHQVLAERYARGEIDDSEYRQRRHVIDGG